MPSATQPFLHVKQNKMHAKIKKGIISGPKRRGKNILIRDKRKVSQRVHIVTLWLTFLLSTYSYPFACMVTEESGGPIKNQIQLWKWILQQQPDLSLCIQAATNWREFSIPTRVQSLYDTLNKHHHVGKTPVEWNDVGGLKIEEGAKLSITDCRLLRCICEAYGMQAQVVPAANPVSDSESESEHDNVAGSWLSIT